MPEPVSEPLEIVKLATVSLFEPRARLPPETVTAVDSESTPELPRDNWPALTVVAPVYVLTADRVSVPKPVFVSEPAPVPITLEIVVLPVPPTVRPSPEPVIVPVSSVSRPESEAIRLLAANVITPEYVLVPLMFRRAPPFETPEPLRLSASPVTVTPPCSCRAALELTTVPAAVLPRAEAFWMLSAPAVIVVVPV